MITLSLTVLLVGQLPIAPPLARVMVDRETAAIDSAGEVLKVLAGTPDQGIPRNLLENAQGIAIIPGVLKAGFVVGGRHGRGVVLARGANGVWSNPVFLSLNGGSIGWQIGVQSTDVVLVFKTRQSLDRILKGKGKLTLGADLAVAAGSVGRQAEADTDAKLRAEIYSYSRSRGLFAGLSVEGAGLTVEHLATRTFYHIEGRGPVDMKSLNTIPSPPSAARLRAVVAGLTSPPPPPPVVVPPAIGVPVPGPGVEPPPAPAPYPPGPGTVPPPAPATPPPPGY
jgi:lipid-binding SYLF domain-containing protein